MLAVLLSSNPEECAPHVGVLQRIIQCFVVTSYQSVGEVYCIHLQVRRLYNLYHSFRQSQHYKASGSFRGTPRWFGMHRKAFVIKSLQFITVV